MTVETRGSGEPDWLGPISMGDASGRTMTTAVSLLDTPKKKACPGWAMVGAVAGRATERHHRRLLRFAGTRP
jgi:hypothetical protein